MSFVTTDPFTGTTLATYQNQTWSECENLIDAAWVDQREWRRRSLKERARAVGLWADDLDRRKDELAKLMTREMGKPIAQSRTEIEKSISTLRYLADHGPAWLQAKAVALPKLQAEIACEPLGPILAVMPWNFPLWQVVRFAGPALIAGNTILLKHAELTTGSARLITGTAANMAPGFQLIRQLITEHETVARVLAHPRVRGVTLTGSTRAGREIAQTAARYLKKSVLELGGSDAYVILKDADPVFAARTCVQGRLVNNGQSCVAAKRFIVVREVADVFLDTFVREMRAVVPADPAREDCALGPLAAKKFQTQLHDQVGDLKSRGARVLCGGEIPPGPAAFYPPTVLLFDGPRPGIGDIELFGPVATVIVVENEREAIAAANDSIYGLGGGIFSRDVKAARALAAELDCGFVAINGFVRSDVHLPFGGVKESGWGRELSPHGILEFCNLQARTWTGIP